MLAQSSFHRREPSRNTIGPGYRQPPTQNSRNFLEALHEDQKRQRLDQQQGHFGKGRRNGLERLQTNRRFSLEDFDGDMQESLRQVKKSRKRKHNTSEDYIWGDQPAKKKRKLSNDEALVTKKPVNPEEIWNGLGCEKVQFKYKLNQHNGEGSGEKSATINKHQKSRMKPATVANLNNLRAMMDDQLDRFTYIRWYKDGKGSKNDIFDVNRDEEIDEKWFHLISDAIGRHSDFKVDARNPSASLADEEFKESGLFTPISGKDQHSSFYHNSNLLTREVRENGGGYEGTGLEKVLNGLSPQHPARRHNKAKLDQNVRVNAKMLDWQRWGSGKDELFMTARTEDFIRYDAGLDATHKVFQYHEDKVLPDGRVIPNAPKTFTYMDGQKRDRVNTDAVFYLVPGMNIPGGHTGAIKGLSSDEEKAKKGQMSFKTLGQGPFHNQRHDKLLGESNSLRSVLATSAYTLDAIMAPDQVKAFTDKGYFLNSKVHGDMNLEENQERLAQSLGYFRPLIAHRLTLLQDKYNALSEDEDYELPQEILRLAELNKQEDREFAEKTLKGMVAALWRDVPHPIQQMAHV